MPAGNLAIIREATGGTVYGTTPTEYSYDTTVRLDAIFSRVGASRIAVAESGHFLILTSQAFVNAGGNGRKGLFSQITVNGTAVADYGNSSGYIRSTAGADECYCNAVAVLDLTSGDEVAAECFRYDTSAGTVTSAGDAAGLQIIKLDDDFDYFAARGTVQVAVPDGTGQNPPTPTFTWLDLGFDTVDEVDAAFTHTTGSSDITLSEGVYVYGYSVNVNSTAGSRRNAVARIVVDSIEDEGSINSGYIRNDSNITSANCEGMGVLQITGTQVVKLQVAQEGEQRGLVNATSWAINIFKVPDQADYTKSVLNPQENLQGTVAQLFPFNVDKVVGETMSRPDANFIQASRPGDYLTISSFHTDRLATDTTSVAPRVCIVSNGAPLPYGRAGEFNRGDQGASGMIAASACGAAISTLAANQNLGGCYDIEAGGIGDLVFFPADRTAITAIRLSSLFLSPVTDTTEKPWQDTEFVSDTNEKPWQDTEFVSDTNEKPWQDLEQLEAQNNKPWQVLSQIEAQSDKPWHDLELVEKDSSKVWQVLESLLSISDKSWNDLQIASDNTSIDWCIKAMVDSQSQLPWNLLQRLEDQDDLRWRVLNSTGDAQSTFNWNALGGIEALSDLPWAMLMCVDHSVTLTWSSISRVAESVGMIWDDLQSATLASDFDWSVLGLVSESTDLSWSLSQHVFDTNQVVWNASSRITSQGGLLWNITQSLEAATIAAWENLTTTESSVDLVWDSFTVVDGSIVLRWNIESDLVSTPVAVILIKDDPVVISIP